MRLLLWLLILAWETSVVICDEVSGVAVPAAPIDPFLIEAPLQRNEDDDKPSSPAVSALHRKQAWHKQKKKKKKLKKTAHVFTRREDEKRVRSWWCRDHRSSLVCSDVQVIDDRGSKALNLSSTEAALLKGRRKERLDDKLRMYSDWCALTRVNSESDLCLAFSHSKQHQAFHGLRHRTRTHGALHAKVTSPQQQGSSRKSRGIVGR